MRSETWVKVAFVDAAMIGYWGCVSCGRKVSNDHKGPCLVCGGRIRRIVSTDMGVRIAAGIGSLSEIEDGGTGAAQVSSASPGSFPRQLLTNRLVQKSPVRST
jgi:hypothetical protein